MTPLDNCITTDEADRQRVPMMGSDIPLGADNVLDLCLRLRMACSGSADPIHDDEACGALAYLRQRLLNWSPSHPSNERFDQCVRQLIHATLAEVEARIGPHGGTR